MKQERPPEGRHTVRFGILAKTAFFSWLVTLVTMAGFVAVILPSQKRTFLENLASKAQGVSVSLQDVAAGALVTEDYGAVLDHCMQVLTGDPSIEFLVLTRNDGFGLVTRPGGWTSEEMSDAWHPKERVVRHGLNRSEFMDEELFHFARPFDYSGIEWGWIHVGLSLEAYRAHVRSSYVRTGLLAGLCILIGLVASMVYARRMVEPILRLRAVAQEVADGDLSARAVVETRDEVEGLANTFNAMTQAVQDREARMRRLSRQLASLVVDPVLHAGDLSQAAPRIARIASDTLGVEQAGVWLFVEGRSAIECLSQYHGTTGTYSRGARVTRVSHEPYFDALSEGRTLAAADACSDPRTACFADDYLRPHNIASMLDAGIRVGGEIIGVICLEHVGEARRWTPEEETFAASLADLSALAVEARDRRSAAEMLRRRDALLEATRFAVERYLHAVDWTDCVEEVLAVVGTAAGANRAYVFQATVREDGTPVMTQRFSWAARGLPMKMKPGRPLEVGYARAGLDRWARLLQGGGLIREHVAELPPSERKLLERFQVTSLMLAPVFVGPEWWGFVGFDQMGPPRDWLQAEEASLRSVADGLGTAMQKQVAQVEAEAARQAAEAASNAKSQFLANMSHEIRTPLNGVMGMLQLLGKEGLTESQGRFVTAALSSADTLLRVIGDVLDLSKIEAGHLELAPTPFAFRDSLDEVLRLFADKAEAKRIEISCAMAPELPDAVVGDDARLQQVLINLVGNAVKFTDHGEVHVRAAPVETTGSGVEVHFSVQDTGPGIPQEQQEAIFESFAQGDTSMRRRYGGTGLGLAISRHLVTLMGGRIWVESKGGRGSTFHFTVRLALAHGESEAPQRSLVGPEDLRVLVVEAAPLARATLCDTLTSWGCSVGEAASAAQAKAELKRAATAPSPYSIVLLDERLPDMDGYGLAGVIRSDARFSTTRLVLMSGVETPSDEELAEHGIQAAIAKPVRSSELYDAIVSTANSTMRQRRLTAAGPVPPAPERGGSRILLVEDNAINREVAWGMLATLGHTCDCLASGLDAVDALARGAYDLVLMDCQMPIMDGYEATAAIRDWERNSRPGSPIPIVALTAHAMKGDRDRCLAAGMDDYLTKPLQMDGLAATLAKWLGRAEAASVEAPPLPSPPDEGSAERDERGLEDLVVARCLGKRTLAGRLLRFFVQQVHEDLETIAAGVAERDGEKVAQAAHRLKGAAGNLGLETCQRAAAELVHLGRDGRTDGTETHMATLRSEAELIAGMRLLREHQESGVAVG